MKNTFEENTYLTTKEDNNIIYYPDEDLLKVGTIESKNSNCSNCGNWKSINFGLAPLTNILTKYPEEGLDIACIRLQKHMCKECETIYWFENGT